LKAIAFLALLAGFAKADQGGEERLKHLSLEQLGNIEVTTATKDREEVARTPAAIFVLSSDDTRRSGATSIPEVLQLVLGSRLYSSSEPATPGHYLGAWRSLESQRDHSFRRLQPSILCRTTSRTISTWGDPA
jgi:hypothetical protein